jgi:hypothetical protein
VAASGFAPDMTQRRRAALALGLALGLATAAVAQSPAPDVPAGDARITGRVLLAGEKSPVPGVEVALYALTREGIPGLRRSESDASGEFVFENLASDPAIGWLVGARFRGVPFPGGRVSFEPGQSELRVEISVDEPTQDASAVRIAEQQLRGVRELEGLRVVETHTLTNTGASTYYAAPEQRAGGSPALELRLPPGATDFQVPLGVLPDGLVREGGRIRWYGPVYPGGQELSWSYLLAPGDVQPAPEAAQSAPGAATESAAPTRFALTPEIPAGTGRFVLLLADAGAQIEGGDLSGPEATQVGGRTLQRFEREAPAAGRLPLRLSLPPARLAPEAVSVSAVRLVVRADDAALDVTETHVLDVRGTSRVLGTSASPLLRIPLPEAAQRLRFGSDQSGIEMAPHPSGGLAAIGSVDAGESVIELAYQLPVDEGPAQLERRFAAHVPVVSVFVADTGQLAPRSERLHRRRPLRTPDRTYLHLEAFEVAPDEAIALELGRLPPPARSARPIALGAVGLAALISIWLLTNPLRARRDGEAQDETDPLDLGREEREALYDAIRDLDHDFETGKVSETDRERLREELRARALLLLDAERSSEAPPAQAAAASSPESAAAPNAPDRRCPACSTESEPGHRFCAHCGQALPEPSAPESAA